MIAQRFKNMMSVCLGDMELMAVGVDVYEKRILAMTEEGDTALILFIDKSYYLRVGEETYVGFTYEEGNLPNSGVFLRLVRKVLSEKHQ